MGIAEKKDKKFVRTSGRGQEKTGNWGISFYAKKFKFKSEEVSTEKASKTRQEKNHLGVDV